MSSRALAQRRQLQREDVEAVQQILAQVARGHRRSGRAVAGRDHAHVHLLCLGRADAHEDAGFEHAQQLDLQVRRHLGDLVEEQRAAVRALEETLMLPFCAREAALLVPEQLAFDQVGGDRTAVDGDERAIAAPAEVMHGARDELFAGSALAGDEHAECRAGHPRDLLVHRLHRRRAAPQVAELPAVFPARAHGRDFRLQRRRPHHAREDAAQLFRVDRLDQVVGGTDPQRLDRRFEARVPGDQHDLGLRGEVGIVEQAHAVAVRQLEVEQHDVGRLQRDLLAGVAQRAGCGDGETFRCDEGRHHVGGIGVVIDDQRVGHRSNDSL